MVLELVETTLNAIVTQKTELAPGLGILRVVPDGWPLPPFRPGQFAVLGLPPAAPRHPLADPDESGNTDGKLLRRSYSIASSSVQNEYLEFYVSLVRSGALSPRLFALAAGDRVWLGPKTSGLFTLDEVPEDADLVLIATGTGLAPYMSMLRSQLTRLPSRRIAVLHGARHASDLGYRDELLAMSGASERFAYLPVISRPDEEPAPWRDEVGYVQDLWRARRLDARWGRRPVPAECHVFLCGNPLMVEEMLGMLQAEGFREHSRREPGQIHVEKYW